MTREQYIQIKSDIQEALERSEFPDIYQIAADMNVSKYEVGDVFMSIILAAEKAYEDQLKIMTLCN